MATEIPVDLTKTGGSLAAALGIGPPPQPPTAPAGPPQPAAPPKAEKAEKAEDPKPAPKCNHCGMDPAEPADHCTPEDELAFVRAVLRGEPFRREYALFGGAVRVTFRDLAPAEMAVVLGVLDKEEAEGKFAPGLPGLASRFDRRTAMCLGLATEAFAAGLTAAVPAHATPDAAHDWVVAQCKAEAVYRAVRGAYVRFANLVAALTQKAMDPSFSRATAGGG